MKILVGDIGGTNTRLATFDGDQVRSISSTRNAQIDDLESYALSYAAEHGPFDGACFGVAGPIVDGSVQMTNLGWKIEQSNLSCALKIPVHLVNDFHAQAHAAPHLTNSQLMALDDLEAPEQTHIALIGAGTGLGEAMCLWTGDGYFAVAGEGSHSRFGPGDDRQLEVLLGLRKRWPDHVSIERVVSGPGILNVYDVLRGENQRHPALDAPDPSAAITELAMTDECPIAVETLKVFVEVLADEAASLALKCNAGTVLVSGGIAPRDR